jgi:hypothetical protein
MADLDSNTKPIPMQKKATEIGGWIEIEVASGSCNVTAVSMEFSKTNSCGRDHGPFSYYSASSK